MARVKQLKARSDQPRDSRAVLELKEVLGLDEADWEEFLRHALNGFAQVYLGWAWHNVDVTFEQPLPAPVSGDRKLDCQNTTMILKMAMVCVAVPLRIRLAPGDAFQRIHHWAWNQVAPPYLSVPS